MHSPHRRSSCHHRLVPRMTQYSLLVERVRRITILAVELPIRACHDLLT